MSIVKSGEYAVEKNSGGFMGRLRDLMENDSFREFATEYFSTWDDTKASMMLIHHYMLIEGEYLERTGKNLESDKIIEILKTIMANSECRKIIVDNMSKFFENGNVTIKELYKKIPHIGI
jgi:predicted nucleic-acid-binding protein